MTTNVTGRQWKNSALVQIGIANIGAGNGFTIPVMPNEVIESLNIDITTAFNSGTTCTLTVSDGTNTYANGVDITSVGRKTVALMGTLFPSGGTLTVTLAQTGTAATAGAGMVEATLARFGGVDYQAGT